SKLETATIKPRIFGERLALEREYYRAFMTYTLCKQAMDGEMVYYGRSAHLLFPGIVHVLKVRVVEDDSVKINDIMRQLRVDRTKAQKYLAEVEADRQQWVRSLYGVSLGDATSYDITFNLSHVSPENAAAALSNIVQLPDFQVTPSSKRAMIDLMQGAQARVLLARDERTFRANVKVRADSSVLTVTYLPQDAEVAAFIPDVLARMEGMRDLRVTMATTNILWVQEAFDAASETFMQVVEIAAKWNAAVELLQYLSENEGWVQEAADGANGQKAVFSRECIGGIEEDDEERFCDDKGLRSTQDALARIGRSGGGKTIYGSWDEIVKVIDRTVPYSLVVVGDICLDKGHSARLRMIRQLQGFLGERLKAPVVNAEEIKAQYLFSRQDLLKMLGYLGLVVVILVVIFTHQRWVLKFLSGTVWKSKLIAATSVFLFVPFFAYLYSHVTRSLMKLIRME
ncbi:MAG: cytidylate kinase family protein, partial [Deltaproteobacteria bacterium]|nr:cytidylate kinase family protein [Deltaproteobacteria bacterium]